MVTSLFIDVGASSAEEVHEMGIEIGCPVIYEPSFTVLSEKNGMVCGTAMDNRGGVAALVTAAAAIKESGKKPVCTTYFVGTVWEEFNIRGAGFAARKVKADIAPVSYTHLDYFITGIRRLSSLSSLQKANTCTHLTFARKRRHRNNFFTAHKRPC